VYDILGSHGEKFQKCVFTFTMVIIIIIIIIIINVYYGKLHCMQPQNSSNTRYPRNKAAGTYL
jgi:hypothetical protein